MEVINQKEIEFPETQKVEVINQREVQRVQVINGIDKLDIGNLPRGVGGKAGKNAKPDEYVVVRLTNGEQFYDAISQSTSTAGVGGGDSDALWLHEQFTWTTVSGQRVTSKVVSFNGTGLKKIVDFVYNDAAEVIEKFVKIERA